MSLLSTLEDRFQAFIKVYPRRVAKADARKAFAKAEKRGIPGPERLAEIILEWLDWRAAMESAGKWIPDLPYPATWLNQDRWEDEHEWPLGSLRQTPEDAERITERRRMHADWLDSDEAREAEREAKEREAMIRRFAR